MATYCTQADFEDYVEGWVTDDPDALERLLERASRDVDAMVGAWIREINGSVFGDLDDNPKGLTDAQKAALARGTCAQAEFRFQMGEEFFARAQYDKVTGPEFSTSGTLPSESPKAIREMQGTGLLRLTTTANYGTGRGDRPPWFSFSYNDTSWDYDPPPLPTQH